MAVHGSGDGAEWVDDLDVDQPHGLDYRQFNHLAVGISKRMASGHTAFADATVGGVHIPGGAGIIGMTDGTPAAADGTFKGRGLIWDSTRRLWCSTYAAEATTCEYTLLKINPCRQWDASVVWTTQHQFDASIDFTSAVCSGSFCVAEHFKCLSGADITNTLACGSDVQIAGDCSIDGTLMLQTTANDLSDGYTYLPNGWIFQFGRSIGIAADVTGDITFCIDFPTATRNVQLTYLLNAKVTDSSLGSVALIDADLEGFGFQNCFTTSGRIYWSAMGY